MATPSDPTQMFWLANCFANSAKLLQDKGGAAGCVPVVVNLAFAIELYFKALIVRDGKPVPKTHSLKELFDALSSANRNAIETYYEEI